MSVQRRLEFQVKKVTRSSARLKKNDQMGDKSEILVESCHTSARTARKPAKVDILVSPIKTASRACASAEKSDSVHTVCKHSIATDEALKQNLKASNSLTATPKKLMTYSGNGSLSPAKVDDAVSLSPRKRLVKFGDMDKSPQCPCSPSKQRKKENCPTPVKNPVIEAVKTPIRSPKLQLFRQSVTSYTKTKQALHTAQPDRLLCREKEMKEIDGFLSTHLTSNTPASMYISGAPGTGKTAVLSHLLKTYRDKCLNPIFINCMMMCSSQGIFNAILSQLNDTSVKAKSAKDAQRQLEKTMTAKGKMILLVLDEIDHLDSKNQDVLYTMFEWPTLPDARLVLIGIANALDLTDRILPRLQARPKCKPKLVNFPPYSKNQIVTILEDRLKESLSGGNCVMEPHALQFCARKVSAVAGDMRKALDICRRAVEKIELEVRSQQVLKPSVTNSPRKTNIPTRVGISHIAKVVSEVYGSKVTSTTNQQQTIPLQQKLVVCSLLVLLKQGKTKEITVGKLHETFLKICKKRNMAVTEQSEFVSMLSLLDTRGILLVKRAKEQRLAKVSMKLDEQEVEYALQDKVLMTSVLRDGVPV